MTRVDFYILPDVDEIARHRFTSRLAARAVAAGNRVYVRAEASAVEPLDTLMWDYPPAQFLPHAPSGRADGEPVTIGSDADEPDGGDDDDQPRRRHPGVPGALRARGGGRSRPTARCTDAPSTASTGNAGTGCSITNSTTGSKETECAVHGRGLLAPLCEGQPLALPR